MSWIRENPGTMMTYVVIAAVLLFFGYVVARGWVMPCLLHVGECPAADTRA